MALEVFQWMKDAGVEADTITYSALISACEKGDLKGCNRPSPP